MQEVQGIDSLLNANLADVDTDFPILANGTYSGIIAECAMGKTKANKDVINVVIKTSMPAPMKKGGTAQPGFPLRHMLMLEPTEKMTVDMIKKNLALFKLAAFGTKDGSFGNPAEYVGRPITVKVVIKSDEEFGEQNRINGFVTPQV